MLPTRVRHTSLPLAASTATVCVEGRQHGMPSWGSKLPREQIWMLVSYIKSLRTPNEPDPPRK
jgi:mono/diheme cytochrome c family protein